MRPAIRAALPGRSPEGTSLRVGPECRARLARLGGMTLSSPARDTNQDCLACLFLVLFFLFLFLFSACFSVSSPSSLFLRTKLGRKHHPLLTRAALSCTWPLLAAAPRRPKSGAPGQKVDPFWRCSSTVQHPAVHFPMAWVLVLSYCTLRGTLNHRVCLNAGDVVLALGATWCQVTRKRCVVHNSTVRVAPVPSAGKLLQSSAIPKERWELPQGMDRGPPLLRSLAPKQPQQPCMLSQRIAPDNPRENHLLDRASLFTLCTTPARENSFLSTSRPSIVCSHTRLQLCSVGLGIGRDGNQVFELLLQNQHWSSQRSSVRRADSLSCNHRSSGPEPSALQELGKRHVSRRTFTFLVLFNFTLSIKQDDLSRPWTTILHCGTFLGLHLQRNPAIIHPASTLPGSASPQTADRPRCTGRREKTEPSSSGSRPPPTFAPDPLDQVQSRWSLPIDAGLLSTSRLGALLVSRLAYSDDELSTIACQSQLLQHAPAGVLRASDLPDVDTTHPNSKTCDIFAGIQLCMPQ